MQQQTLTTITTDTDGTENDSTDTGTCTDPSTRIYNFDELETNHPPDAPDMWFKRESTNQYGNEVFVIDGPDTYQDMVETGLKDALDWDTTHRSWTGRYWTIDATDESIKHFEEKAEEFGITVDTREPEDRDSLDDQYSAGGPVSQIAEDIDVGEHITVRYSMKNGNGTATKRGTVTRKDKIGTTLRSSVWTAIIEFERDDDGHTMWIQDDRGDEQVFSEGGLYTAGSHAPYVGEVLRV